MKKELCELKIKRANDLVHVELYWIYENSSINSSMEAKQSDQQKYCGEKTHHLYKWNNF